MAKWRTHDYKCSNDACQHFEILLLDVSDPAELNAEGEVLPLRECPICSKYTFQRVLAMPTGLRASFADGQKRKGWAELREASKLEKEKAVTKSADRRREIEKEIRKTGVRIGQKP